MSHLHVRVLLGALLASCMACSSTPAPSDASVDTATGLDAGMTDAVASGDTPVASDVLANSDMGPDGLVAPQYPNCLQALDGGGYRAWLTCDVSMTCVYPCTTCSGAPNTCLLLSSRGNLSMCTSSCAECTSGGVSLPDSCSGTCVNLLHDAQNCGTCGHACPAGVACNAGHCCPSGSGSWNASCNLCCPGTAACVDGGMNPNLGCAPAD